MNPGLSIIWLNSCLFEIVKKKRHYNNHLRKCILKHLTKPNLLLIEQYNHTWCVQFILCLITTNMTATRCAVVTVFFMYDTCMVTLSTEVCIKAWNLFTPLNLSISCVCINYNTVKCKNTPQKKKCFHWCFYERLERIHGISISLQGTRRFVCIELSVSRGWIKLASQGTKLLHDRSIFWGFLRQTVELINLLK